MNSVLWLFEAKQAPALRIQFHHSQRQKTLLLGYLVFIFPSRGRRTIVTQRTFRATPEAVWALLRTAPANIVSQTVDPFDQAVTIITAQPKWARFKPEARPGDEPSRQSAGAVTSRLRVLLHEPPLKVVTRFDDIGGRPFPFGKDSTLTEQLEAVPSGTKVVLCFDGELGSSLQALAMRLTQRRTLANVGKALRLGSG